MKLLKLAVALGALGLSTQAAAQVVFYEHDGFNGRTFTAAAVPGPITQRLIDAYKELVGCDFVGQYLQRLDA